MTPIAHRANRALLSLALGLAFAVLLTALAPAADGKTRPLRTGISYLYIDDAEPIAFEKVRRAGGTMVLTPLEWEAVVPAKRPSDWDPRDPGDPNYEWESYDVWVQEAVAAGLTPVLQIRGAPEWAQRCRTTAIDRPCDPSPADLAAFSVAAARRYSGNFEGLPRVRYWQGLNEPNLSLFFEPQYRDGKLVSPALYRNLINAFYGAIKSVHRSNLVILAGLGPNAVPGYTVGPMHFARQLLCMRTNRRPAAGGCGGGVRFDIFDIHPYTTGSPAHRGGPNDVQLGDLEKLQRLIRAADRAGRIKGRFRRTPLWVTELAWDSRPPDPGGLPFRVLNRWTAEALFRSWRAGVSNVFWFSLHDFARRSGQPWHESLEAGLYFRGATLAEDEAKPNRQAFRFPFVSYPRQRGLYFWGRTPSAGPGRVLIQVRRRGGWRRIHVARADRNGIFRGVARTRYGRKRRGSVRAVFAGERAVPFSMKPIGDFYHPPFGSPVED